MTDTVEPTPQAHATQSQSSVQDRCTLTDAEREAISEVVDCLTETGTTLANPTTTRNTLAALLERLA